MRKITVSVQVDAEKLRAIQFYAGRKNSAVETELEEEICSRPCIFSAKAPFSCW